MDISEYLIILERLKSYKLLEEIQWDLLKISFDIFKDDLMILIFLILLNIHLYPFFCSMELHISLYSIKLIFHLKEDYQFLILHLKVLKLLFLY